MQKKSCNQNYLRASADSAIYTRHENTFCNISSVCMTFKSCDTRNSNNFRPGRVEVEIKSISLEANTPNDRIALLLWQIDKNEEVVEVVVVVISSSTGNDLRTSGTPVNLKLISGQVVHYHSY